MSLQAKTEDFRSDLRRSQALSASHPLLGLSSLPERVALYVPSTVAGDRPAPTEAVAYWLDLVASSLATWFSGCTAIAGQGFYVSDGGHLVRESVTVIASQCSSDDLAHRLPEVLHLAHRLADEMGQEAVGLEVNGRLYFVRPV